MSPIREKFISIIISMKKISEMLKEASTDDGTFYSSLYDLYVFIGLAKGVDDIKNGRTIPLEKLENYFNNYFNF